MATPKRPDTPPADVDLDAKRLWNGTRDWLIAAGLWELPVDPTTLERYVRADARGRDARTTLREEGLTSTGSRGQLIEHPAVKTAREAERDAHEYAKEMCLTPLARRRHGLGGQPEPVDPLYGRA